MTPRLYLRGIAWVHAVHLVFAFAGAGLAAAAWAPAALTAVPIVVVTAIALAASVPILRGLQGRGTGDGMFEDGRRVDPDAWQRLAGLEVAQTWLLVPPFAAGVIFPFATEGFGLAFAGLLIALIGAAWIRILLGVRWGLFQGLRASNLLHRDDAPAALRITERVIAAAWIPDDQKRLSRAINVDARTQCGDLAGGRAALEALWEGTLDLQAFPLALDRLGRDDPRLAHQVLSATEPTTLLDRRALAVLRGYVTIVEGRWDPAVDAELAEVAALLPPRFADTVWRVLAAGRQGAGDGDGARAALRSVVGPEHTRPWFAAASPRLAGLLADAGAGRPSAPRAATPPVQPTAPAPTAAPADPFAPPKGTLRAEGRMPALRGAVPFEFAGLALRTRSWLPLPREALLAIRVVSALMLLPLISILGVLLSLEGFAFGAVGLVAPFLGTLALVLSLATAAIAPAIELLAPRAGPRLVLDDGSPIGHRWWAAYRWAEGGGAAMLGLTIAALGPALATAVSLHALAAWLTVPLGLLIGVTGLTRSRVQLAASRVLFGDARAEALRLDARVGKNALLRPALAVWRGAAWLRAGEPTRAADAWRELQGGVPKIREVLAWLDVTRGAIDVDAALGTDPAPGLGPALRLAIFQGLVAARAGVPERVAPRLVGWIDLAWTVRNPFGDLLALAIAGARPGPDAWEGLPPVDRDSLDWAVVAWPFLAAARDAAPAAPR